MPLFFGHHLQLSIPEERVEDDEKVLTTRYTPLGVVGAICPWYATSHKNRLPTLALTHA